jgi:hypothetical protein
MKANKGYKPMAKEKDYAKPKNDESKATLRYMYGRSSPADLRKAQIGNTYRMPARGQHSNRATGASGAAGGRKR